MVAEMEREERFRKINECNRLRRAQETDDKQGSHEQCTSIRNAAYCNLPWLTIDK